MRVASRRQLVLAGALLVGITALTFSPALHGTFILDDGPLVAHNRYIQDLRFLGRAFTQPFQAVSSEANADPQGWTNIYYRPFVTLSFLLDFQLHGPQASGFHLTNLLLHLVVTLLVFALLVRLLCSVSPAAPLWVPFVATLLFALHPSRAEAVAWISGRTDVLMSAWLLLALLLFWRALATPRRRGLVLVAAWLAYAVALLCKELAVVLAVLVPALDWQIIPREQGRRRALLWCHLPLAAVTLGFVVWRMLWQSALLGRRWGWNAFEHLSAVLHSVGYYGLLVLCPYRPSMQVGVDINPAAPSWPVLLLGIAALLLWCGGLWLALRRRNALVALGLILIAASLLPVLNIMPLALETLASERFLYFPLVGLALVIVPALQRLLRCTPWPRAPLVVALGLLLGSWAGATAQRSEDFSDPLRFWTSEVSANPGSPRAQLSLAQQLVRKQRYAEAERALAQALRSLQLWRQTRRFRARPGVELQAVLRLVAARLEQPSDLAPQRLVTLVRFLTALVPTGPTAPAAQLALPDLGLALELDVADSRLLPLLDVYRPTILELLGQAASRLGDDALAERTLRQAVQLRPERYQLWLRLCQARLRAGALAAAEQACSEGKRLAGATPALRRFEAVRAQATTQFKALAALPAAEHATARAHWLRAELFMITAAPLRAEPHLREVLRLAPTDRRAWATLSLLLAAHGAPAEARAVLALARDHFGDEPGLSELARELERVQRERRELLSE